MSKKSSNFFKLFGAGAAMGVGAAVPGVSGGTIAVIFKVFDKIVWAISNLFKKFKTSFMILLPVVLGAIIAAVPCLIFFRYAIEQFLFAIVCLFAGFVAGSFSDVKKEVEGVKFSEKHIVLLTISILFTLAIGVCSVFFADAINIEGHFINPEWWFYLVLIPVGMIAAIAFIVPGISGSMILLVLGFYAPILKYVMEYIKDFSNHGGQALGFVGALALGAIIGVLGISKALHYLLDKHHDSTFMVIIGFIIGSTMTLFFNNNMWTYYMGWAGVEIVETWLPLYIEIPIGIAFLIGGAFVTFFLTKLAKKNIKEESEETTENEKDEQ